jgi:hypothetical protein
MCENKTTASLCLHIAHLTSEILRQHCHNISQQIIQIQMLITNLSKHKSLCAVFT